ncbi:MAG: hypothetical protein ACPL1Y_07715 [Thermoplasmata archaeon]
MPSSYVRGRFLNLYLNYITSRWGVLGYNSCLKETGLQKYGKIEESTSYPVSCLFEIISWINREKSPEHVLNAGKYVALTMLQKSPEKDVKKAIQKLAYTLTELFDYAHISVHMEEHSAKFYVGNINVGEECCHTWIGFLKGVGEHTNHNLNVKETECQSKNGKFCCFEVTW